MLLHPELDKKENEKRKAKILDQQLGGWIIESHCWGIPDDQNLQTCEWCGMKANTFARTFASDEFKLCRENPLIKQVEENAYEFYS